MSVKLKEGLQGVSANAMHTTAIKQLTSLVEGETDMIANMANVAAYLYHTFKYFWVGFYIHKNDQLVLGPFQGPIACTRINLDKGVCGHAATTKQTVIVPDVNQFPGHIACSAESQSEIVIPFVKENRTIFVLDVDSKQLDYFNEKDQQFLEEVVQLLV